MKYLILYILLIVSLFTSITLQDFNNSLELSALTSINLALGCGWDLNVATLCSLISNLLCDSSQTSITYIKLFDPNPAVITPLPPAIYDLHGLVDLWIESNLVQVPSSFWTQSGPAFPKLKLIYFKYLDTPFDEPVNIPATVTEFDIFECYATLPQSIFNYNFEFFDVGSVNSMDYPVFPASISAPSNIRELRTRNWGSFNLDGSNFKNLTNLIIGYYGLNPITYNLYNTFPKLEDLSIVLNSAGTTFHDFPTSVLTSPNLKRLSMYDKNFKLLIGPTAQLTFTSTVLESLYFSEMDFSQLPVPGLVVNSNKVEVGFSVCKINIDTLNLLQFTSVDIGGTKSSGNLPSGSYQNMNRMSISANYSGTVPNGLCDIQKNFDLSNTLVTSLPDCFICNWGSNDGYGTLFQGNSLLPAYTQTCPLVRFDLNYSTGPFPTSGGIMTISGDYLGWAVYNQDDIVYPPKYPAFGNKLLKFELPAGTGISKQIQIKFHAKANASSPTYTLNYNYQPPVISTIEINTFSNGLTVKGNNFGDQTKNVTSMIVAGKNILNFVTVSWFDDPNSIIYPDFVVPYKYNLTFSIRLTVDGQSTYKIIKAGVPKINQPIPDIWSAGGVLTLLGEYLTFDSTIVSITLYNQNISSRFVLGNANEVRYSYDPIEAGTYSLVFDLDDYHLETTINVTDVPPCKVVHGTCEGTKPICYKPWTGPICDSLPANLTQPLPTDQTHPVSEPSTPYIVDYNGVQSEFTYKIALKSFNELNENGDIVKINSLAATPTGSTDGNVTTAIYAFPSCQLQIDWISADSNLLALLSYEFEFIRSTLRYQFICFSYTWLLPTNTAELIYRVDFNMISTNLNETCSSYKTDSLPTNSLYNYIQSKVNYMDVYARVLKNCALDQFMDCSQYITNRLISNDNNSISFEIVAKLPNFSVFAMEADFNVLVESDGCSNGSDSSFSSSEGSITNSATTGVISGGSTTAGGTTAGGTTGQNNGNTCKGEPQCYGKGQCINSECICQEGWKGEICDSQDTKLPPITNPNNTNPNVDTPIIDDGSDGGESKLAFHISIYSIREIDYTGKVVRTQTFDSSWNFTTQKSNEIETFNYSYQLFNETEIKVKVDYFFSQQTIEFAGVSSTKIPGSIKYSANITHWPFIQKSNQLQVIFKAGAEDKAESKDTCTYKSIEYDSNNGNLKSVSIQINDRTFNASFTNLAIVDGFKTIIKNVIVPNPIEDSNTQASILVGINTPHHNEYTLIDPDFSLLISYVPSNEKEGSICEAKDKKKLSGAQIAGIVIGCVVFVAAICAIVVYNIKKNKENSNLNKLLSKKLSKL